MTSEETTAGTHTVSNVRTWTLPKSTEDYVRERVERVNKRIRKHGLKPYALTIEPGAPVPEFERYGANGVKVIDGIDWPTVDGRPCPVMWHETITVTLTGEPPSYAGWSFVATIVRDPHAGTLTRVVPGVEVNLDALRARDASECDHCRTPRDRHNVYAVRNDATGELKQVGSTCLTAFLGIHISLADVDSVLRNTLDDEFSELGGGGFSDSDRAANPADVLAIAAHLVQRHGWMSKSGSCEGGQLPTASIIMDVLAPGSNYQKREFAREVWQALSADDYATGAAILAYARDIDGGSEWCKNLRAVAGGERVSLRNVPLLASAVPSYNKHVERVIMERVALNSTHQGTPGEKWIFPALTVARVTARENTFSPWQELTYMVKFVDRDGNVFVWRTANFAFNPGDVLDMTAKVKEHSEYKDVRETWVTHAKLTPALCGPQLPNRPVPAPVKATRTRKSATKKPAAPVADAAPAASTETDPWAALADMIGAQ